MSHGNINRYSVGFPFVYDDIFLIAEVDKNSGQQWLIMRKIDLKYNRTLLEDRIQCIHATITTLTVDNFEDKVSKVEELEKDMLNLRSSEGAPEIRLTPEERFFALKSWVQGIAEAGVNAVTIQEDIEHLAHLFNPIGKRLFNFLLKAKIDFIQAFLAQMERDCHFEGEYHKPSIHANLLKMLDITILEESEAWNRWRDQVEVNYEWNDEWKVYTIKHFKDIMESIFEFEPSANIFLENPKTHVILMMPEARILPDWEKVTKESVAYDKIFRFCYKDEETGLLALDLSANKIASLVKIQGLERVSHLEQLHLENNLFEKLGGFEIFPNLRRLYLNFNYITQIEGLTELNQLEVLALGNNQINKIEGLDSLTNLKELYLYDNKLGKIEGLTNLKNLEVLHLSGNDIGTISGLDNLINLKNLVLRSNNLINLQGLEALVNLEELDLGYNKIEVEPELSYLPKIKNLLLNNNPYKS